MNHVNNFAFPRLLFSEIRVDNAAELWYTIAEIEEEPTVLTVPLFAPG